jgi:TolB-like protein/predicted negative regulator of RcsB-dependent stress response
MMMRSQPIRSRLAAIAAAVTAALGAPALSASSLAQGWLVLPFANHSGEASLDWLGEGFALSLDEQLRGAGQTTVPHAAARALLAEWRLPAGRGPTLASALKASDQIGAERVVTGRFRLHEGELKVEAEVIDPDEPGMRGEARLQARLGDLLDLQRRLARALIKAGEEGLATARAVRDNAPAPPLAAYEQYVRALLTPQTAQRLQALRQAARSFPSYALLHFRLAQELHDSGEEDEALASLQKIGEVRFLLSPEARLLEVEIRLQRGEAGSALAAADRALDLRETAQGRLLRAEALVAQGSPGEARAEIARARELGAPAEECEALERRLAALPPTAAN